MKFGKLLRWTEQQLAGLGFVAEQVDSPFDIRKGKAELELNSHSWSHSQGTEVKCAHLFGPRAEVLNLMAYPRNALQVPIFAVELILFGERPRVAVVDLQPAGGLESDPTWTQRICRQLDSLPEEVRSSLPSGGQLPEWATSHFTPSCVYTRPTEFRQMAGVYLAYRHFFRVWAEEFFPLEGPLSGLTELVHYQNHHVENTPGRKFLRTSFGEDWTERYLAEFMYTSRHRGRGAA